MIMGTIDGALVYVATPPKSLLPLLRIPNTVKHEDRLCD